MPSEAEQRGRGRRTVVSVPGWPLTGSFGPRRHGGGGGKGGLGTLGAHMYLRSIQPDRQSQTWFKHHHSFKTRDLDITTITTPKSRLGMAPHEI